MKHALLGGASGIALIAAGGGVSVLAGAAVVTLGAQMVLRRRARRLPVQDPGAQGPLLSDLDTRAVTRGFLLYFVVPLWLCAGVADWICHRASDIQDTTGVKETLTHLLMRAETGVPVPAGLFLEVTSPVLALMIAAFFLHEATALWDVTYAVTRWEVTFIQQHVHSFLEMLPLMAVAFISLLHWPRLLALVGLAEDPDPSIRLKQVRLPVGYVAASLSAIGFFELLPYLEELWRDWRAHPGEMVPSGATEVVPE
jgi:hypothetical protein